VGGGGNTHVPGSVALGNAEKSGCHGDHATPVSILTVLYDIPLRTYSVNEKCREVGNGTPESPGWWVVAATLTSRVVWR